MYDYEPIGNSGQAFAEVFNAEHGQTLFQCTTDSVALQLCKILDGYYSAEDAA